MKIRLVGHDKLHDPEKHLEPLEACLSRLKDKNDQTKLVLWLGCPFCGQEILAADHKVTQEPDGSVTVEPSLVCPTNGCTGHYLIKNSEIIPC